MLENAHIRQGTIEQDSKDIERDRVKVQNQLLIGQQVGYYGIRQAIVQALCNEKQKLSKNPIESTELQECKLSESPILVAFAARVLHAVNRTQSGGDSFDALCKPSTLSFFSFLSSICC